MSVPSGVVTSSQDAETSQLSTDQIGRLMRDDLQRLSGLVSQLKAVTVGSGYAKLSVPYAGMASVTMILDTVSGSGAGNFQTFQLTVNGGAVGTQIITTLTTPIPAYQGGRALGSVSVAKGDVLGVAIVNTGSPSPTLTATNISLLADLTRS